MRDDVWFQVLNHEGEEKAGRTQAYDMSDNSLVDRLRYAVKAQCPNATASCDEPSGLQGHRFVSQQATVRFWKTVGRYWKRDNIHCGIATAAPASFRAARCDSCASRGVVCERFAVFCTQASQTRRCRYRRGCRQCRR
ncbi:hypothetical protein L917_04764 [Phytophthora nicotianae]|uniref:Uncharacterized protein n=1 Tax=Phytophthora nicotianae TaxID=4792 RepID=W2LN07_PHYNI|nr:hypothetical protein L917_04764 [Phytophthora nicotianae]